MSMTTLYVIGAIVGFALFVCAQFPLARWVAQQKEWKKVNILLGVAQYIFWYRNEAVIFTRGGKEEVIEGEGGERVIYPILGERLRARVSLAHQLSEIDCIVHMFEIIPCNIKVAIRWVVEDPSEFINKNDSAKHLSTSGEITAQNVMEEWLKVLTGEISQVVSQESFKAGFLYMILLKESQKQALDEDSNVADDLNPSVATISTKLGHVLLDKLNEKIRNYGVSVVEAAIPSVGMAPNDREQLRDILFDRLKIERAELDARVREITEESQIEIDRKRHAMHRQELGPEAARILEVMKRISPELKVNQEEFFKIIIALEGGNAKLGLPGQEPMELGPATDHS